MRKPIHIQPLLEKTIKITGKAVVDELCTCGRKKSEHSPDVYQIPGQTVVEHGAGDGVNCERFTWKAFILEDGSTV